MKLNIIHSRICLLFIFCCLSWFAVAQANDDEKKLLLGKWVFEDASIPVNEYETSFALNNKYIKFYSEIEINSKELLIKDKKKVHKSKYEIAGNFLHFDLPSGESIVADWDIIEGELYLEYKTKDIFDASKEMSVLLLYKRK